MKLGLYDLKHSKTKFVLSMTDEEFKEFKETIPSPLNRWRLIVKNNKLNILPTGMGALASKQERGFMTLTQINSDGYYNGEHRPFRASIIPESTMIYSAGPKLEIDLDFAKTTNEAIAKKILERRENTINGTPLIRIDLQ